MNKRYNQHKKNIISLNEGEEFCSKCDGRGLTREYTNYINDYLTLVCDKCLGDGKIDWIEKAVGKTNVNII